MVTDLILHTKKNLKKYKIKTIDDVYNSKKFIVSFSPKLIKANNQIREFLKLNMYENKSVKEMTDKAEKIIKTLYIYLIKNNKKFLPSDIKNKWGLERSVADFIAGMTDKFAIDLYNKIR
jgi:dGTPase